MFRLPASIASKSPKFALLVFATTTVYVIYYYHHFSKTISTPHSPSHVERTKDNLTDSNLSALQKHVLFWDRDGDNIIFPQDVYTGFREIGFSIPFSLASLLIPVFFSYPTSVAHSYIPDPLFRISLSSIHYAKHGSDTGIYDSKGNIRAQFFEDLFAEFDSSGMGSLGARDLLNLLANNRVAADPAGWSFAAMEWGSTWLLLQKDGRVWKEDLRQCYDGSLFWRLKEEKEEGLVLQRGYGLREFWRDVCTWTRGRWDGNAAAKKKTIINS